MPASDKPEAAVEERAEGEIEAGAHDVGEELTRLETVLDSMVEGFGAMSNRAAVAEENHRKLAEALRNTDVEEMAPTELQARLEALAEENARLRAGLEEAQTRAERMMEDELADE